MDTDWALEQLREYLYLHEQIPLTPEEKIANPKRKSRIRGSLEERRQKEFVIQAIASTVYENPDLRWINKDFANRLVWELTDGDHVHERLGLDQPAPTIAANSLHPWVWSAARPHWTSGNHDAALWAAAININSRLQQKVGRKDVGEAKLRRVLQCRTPSAQAPRLRLCDDTNPELFRDKHVGAASLGRGLFSAIRNPLNHVHADEHEISSQEALEALAGFSLLARWIDKAEVVRATEDEESSDR